MGVLLTVKPLVPTLTTQPRVVTPDPKEAITVTAGDVVVALDFGADVTIDTLYIGYHSAAGAQLASITRQSAYNGGTATNVATNIALAPLGLGFPNHSLARFTATTGRYFNVTLSRNSGAAFYVGVVAVGAGFQTQWGHEFGAGRLIEDTGSADRLFGGGFGIDEGVAAGGYQWTLGDIQPTELRQLYQLVKDRRTTRTVLVVEDPDVTDGLNERIHWGLFRKLDPYERLNPLDTKWSFVIGDWA